MSCNTLSGLLRCFYVPNYKHFKYNKSHEKHQQRIMKLNAKQTLGYVL